MESVAGLVLLPLLLLFLLLHLLLLVLFFVFLATLVSHACSLSAIMTCGGELRGCGGGLPPAEQARRWPSACGEQQHQNLGVSGQSEPSGQHEGEQDTTTSVRPPLGAMPQLRRPCRNNSHQHQHQGVMITMVIT
jgi:hypothetical protein